jgi:pimeloyl-ACP methyl ester carboxylesterase
VATFALSHGGGGSAWDWHLVAPALRELGHEAVAVDLPCEVESAGWSQYADTVVRVVEDRSDLGSLPGWSTKPTPARQSSAWIRTDRGSLVPLRTSGGWN